MFQMAVDFEKMCPSQLQGQRVIGKNHGAAKINKGVRHNETCRNSVHIANLRVRFPIPIWLVLDIAVYFLEADTIDTPGRLINQS